ncbi:efflux RND transporter periplasmic adaptor subunit [Nocardioides sp. NPDC051685]|uniref:efflux RND transporter periplasmic adaptor subunit n=1 Tax=Nocardioides sp. NPDC051685 TaxID=3364334 RepID=UPI0037B9857B
MTNTSTLRARRPRTLPIVALAALVVIAGGGYTAYAATASSSAGYRAAAVTTGDVEQTLSLTGTVAPNGRADLAFATDGTVETVVAEGDTVKKGQVVARLDRTSLKKSLTSAKATLAAARAQLQSDKEAQVSGVASTSSTGSSGEDVPAVWTGSTPSSDARTASTATTADLVADVKKLQNAVVSAQKALDTADAELGSAQTELASALEKLTALVAVGGTLDEDGELAGALKAAQESCAADTSTSTSCDKDLETALGAQRSAGGTVTEATALLGSAQSAVAAAKTAVSTARTDLKDYSEQLDETLAAAGTSGGQNPDQPSGGQSQQGQPSGGAPESGVAPESGGAPDPGGSGGQSGSVSGGSGESGMSGGSGGSGGESVTAATLAKDQAEIDQAKADVAQAKAALAGAVLKAPASGTVASVSVEKGDSASAGTDAVTLIAKGLTSVELTVSATQVEQLEVGQVAEVTPAGAEQFLPGKVTLVGQVPDTSSGSSTFPVTVTLDETGLDLLAGNMATVDVVVGSTEDVLTIPASALDSGSVTVVDGDRTERRQVTTGLVGATRIEVTDGLQKGEQVVLADLSQELPSGDTSGQGGPGRTGDDVQRFVGPGGQMPGMPGGGQG